MLRVAICEDDIKDVELLEQCIRQSGMPVEIQRFTHGKELLERLAQERFHLLFLDIYLPDMQGTDIAAHIRQTDSDIVIAFTTNSEDHTLAGYRVNALKYLIKPVRAADVAQTLELAQLLDSRRPQCTVFARQRKVDIALEDICYVEVHNHTCHIHTVREVLETGNTIEEMAALLPPPCFVKCHRSFIVNLDHVRDVDRDFIMKSGDTVYIRGKDLGAIKRAWAEYLFQAARR